MNLEQKIDNLLKAGGCKLPELLNLIADDMPEESLASHVLRQSAKSMIETARLVKWMDENYTPKIKP